MKFLYKLSGREEIFVKISNAVPIILISLLTELIGCAPSMVYSPSINLPPKPLQKEELQLLGGIGYLPETRPDKTPKKLTLGGETTLRYGFSDFYSMQIKGWYDFSKNLSDYQRWGFAVASTFLFNDSCIYRLP